MHDAGLDGPTLSLSSTALMILRMFTGVAEKNLKTSCTFDKSESAFCLWTPQMKPHRNPGSCLGVNQAIGSVPEIQTGSLFPFQHLSRLWSFTRGLAGDATD